MAPFSINNRTVDTWPESAAACSAETISSINQHLTNFSTFIRRLASVFVYSAYLKKLLFQDMTYVAF